MNKDHTQFVLSMNLRETLTAAAVQGLLAGRTPVRAPYNTQEIAQLAVEIADWAIIELAKNQPQATDQHVIDPESHML